MLDLVAERVNLFPTPSSRSHHQGGPVLREDLRLRHLRGETRRRRPEERGEERPVSDSYPSSLTTNPTRYCVCEYVSFRRGDHEFCPFLSRCVPPFRSGRKVLGNGTLFLRKVRVPGKATAVRPDFMTYEP